MNLVRHSYMVNFGGVVVGFPQVIEWRGGTELGGLYTYLVVPMVEIKANEIDSSTIRACMYNLGNDIGTDDHTNCR